MLVKRIVVLYGLALAHFSFAQKDSTHLPFAIADEKKLDEEDLANKKEGAYVTGIPDISSDPVNGFGIGAEGSLFFNGKKTDPFFAYTPYRAELNIAVFITTRSQKEVKLGFDVPYIFNTKWRLRGEAAYEVNPNLLYFGIDESSLKGLQYFPGGDTTKSEVNNASYSDYEHSLTGTKAYYNTYQKEEAILNISMERSFLEGKLRALVGMEAAEVKMSSPLNKMHSKAFLDAQSRKILGFGNNFIDFFQTGLIYDTRDLESDPNKGIFAELNNELSLKALGSSFDFNKTFFHFNLYTRFLPNTFKKWVFAARFGVGYTAGNAPFFEYQDQWSSEGSIEGLGGGATLRGFKQSRFLARTMQFTNVELRCRFLQFNFLKQHFAFSGVPFFDAGGVWNNLNTTSLTRNLRYSEGLGLRIAWNVNTILRFDYAISSEDRQFFFQLGHTF